MIELEIQQQTEKELVSSQERAVATV